MSTDQRARIGARLVARQNGGDRKSDQFAKLQTDLVTQAQAAAMVDVSPRTLFAAMRATMKVGGKEANRLKLADCSAPPISLAQAADAVGVSRATAVQAAKVIRDGAPNNHPAHFVIFCNVHYRKR